MDKNTIGKLTDSFNTIIQQVPDTDVEYWYARQIMSVLGYDRWENFSRVIHKASIACETSGGEVSNHFRGVTKMVQIGSRAERPIDDPRKEIIAFAQTYFAVQTRKQELIEERIHLQERLQARQKLTESETELSRNIYERGVDDKGFGRIRSKGDAALFGGHTTAQMKEKLMMPSNRPLADFLPTVTIAAKNLAAEITNHNVKQHDLQGEKANDQ